MIFRYYGATAHLVIESMEDLRSVVQLGEAHWVATGVPVEGIDCDRTFLDFVDADGDGRLLCGEVKEAIEWLLGKLRNPVVGSQVLRLGDINTDSQEGRGIHEAVEKTLARDGRAGQTEITLDIVRRIKTEMQNSLVSADGVVLPEAAKDDDLKSLLVDILATVGGEGHPSGKQGVSEAQVGKFFAEARAYLEFQREGELGDKKHTGVMPLGSATSSAYELLTSIRDKVDQYFTQCRVVALDPRWSEQFGTTREMEKIDLTDRAFIEQVLRKSPLSKPRSDRMLRFENCLNPQFELSILRLRKEVLKPALGHPMDALSEKDWQAVKTFFADHQTWYEKTGKNLVKPLGSDKIRGYCNDGYAERLRTLIAQGLSTASAVEDVRLVEKLILYQVHLLSLANNFVSFPDLYANDRHALFEEGTLVMDGRYFRFAVRVRNRAEHVKLAEKSHMFVLYVEVAKGGGEYYEVAVPVTAGGRGNLTIGKRGLFHDLEGREHDAKVVHILQNPIGIFEAIVAPFEKLGRMLMGKIESMTSAAEGKLDSAVSKTPPQAQKASPSPSAALTIGGIMMGTAALGSAGAFITKTLAGLGFYKLVIGIGVAIGAVILPTVAAAFVKLRRRDFSSILEGCGWTINARMRLTHRQGLFFTHRPKRPDEMSALGGRGFVFFLLVLLVALIFYWVNR